MTDTPNDTGAPAPDATPAPDPQPGGAQARRESRLAARAERDSRAKGLFDRAMGNAPDPAPAVPDPASVPAPPDSQVLRKLEAAQSEAHQRKAELEQLRAEYEAAKSRADEYGQIRESVADPEGALRAIQRLGVDLPGLLDALADGTVKPPQPYAELPPEVAERMKSLEEKATAWEKAQAEEAARAESTKRQQERTAAIEADIPYVTEKVQALGDEYAALAATPGMLRQVVEIAHSQIDGGVEPSAVDLDGLLKQANQAIMNDAKALLSNEAAIRQLVSDPETRAIVSRALGNPPTNGAPSLKPHGNRPEPQSSIANHQTAEQPSQNQPISRAERRRRLHEAAKRVLGSDS